MKIIRHINHHGGVFEHWNVGIEEEGSDRNRSTGHLPMRFDIRNSDDARATMSHLLDMGLMADDEYDTDPTAKVMIPKPVAVYVHSVHKSADFEDLGIGTGV